MSPPASQASRLRATLRASLGDLRLDVSIDTAGESLVVVGPNGAGKSTLLRLLLGVERPAGGRIALGDAVLFDDAAGIDRPTEARRLGYVPQHLALFPHLTALDNVAFGGAGSRAERRSRARALLDEMQAGHLADRRPDALSGGERQGVALARALAADPAVVLLDEPLGALDVTARDRVRAFLVGHLAARGVPALMVTHDAADAAAFDTAVVVLEGGRVVQRGTLAELGAAPASPWVAAFFGAAPVMPAPASAPVRGPRAR